MRKFQQFDSNGWFADHTHTHVTVDLDLTCMFAMNLFNFQNICVIFTELALCPLHAHYVFGHHLYLKMQIFMELWANFWLIQFSKFSIIIVCLSCIRDLLVKFFGQKCVYHKCKRFHANTSLSLGIIMDHSTRAIIITSSSCSLHSYATTTIYLQQLNFFVFPFFNLYLIHIHLQEVSIYIIKLFMNKYDDCGLIKLTGERCTIVTILCMCCCCIVYWIWFMAAICKFISMDCHALYC